MIKFHKLTEENKPDVGRDVLILIDKWILSDGTVKPNPTPYCYLVERQSYQENFLVAKQDDDEKKFEWVKEDCYVERYGECYACWRASEIGGWIYLDELKWEIEEEE